MTDVFGKKLLYIYRDKISKIRVAARTKQEAIDILTKELNQTVELITQRNIGYAGNQARII
jgi:hypothetical protein